ncbi:FAD-dependent monooxygenase [Aestuariivirga litoralis]|uniref:FAD-dependent monooxygenase n=1 Tax=Aestuariivirga litoralis TaxID=2650924 RepID=UPI0018C6722A|nr:FAD-dependent monooxygenase [Aestuariivirga litoralis]MBG1233753.1 2-octaprenyl-6-methoxyphenyl hydroxylase [Aestuariivirga litoralis]
MDKFDVIVAGAGLNGLAAALALGGRRCRTPLKVAVIDRADPAKFAVAAHDSRCSALTAASVNMLQALGAWKAMAAQAQAMNSIIVTNAKTVEAREALLGFPDLSEKSPALFLENQLIFKGLLDEIGQSPQISFITGHAIKDFQFGPGLAQVTLDDGRTLKANLVIGCDGRGSASRAAAGIKTQGWAYDQSAITLTVGHEFPHGGEAQEHFHDHGVFAILPLSGNRSSIVWTAQHDVAQAICALPDDAFLVELEKHFGTHLGKLELLSARHVYPLELKLSDSFFGARLALMGDAAHVVHPLAGLGLNLGFKDVAALADCVFEAAALGSDIGSVAVLETYARWRRFDTFANAALMDGMNRLFAQDNEPLRLLRHAGLRLADRMGPLKKVLVNEAAGLTGQVPRLMRGLAA